MSETDDTTETDDTEELTETEAVQERREQLNDAASKAGWLLGSAVRAPVDVAQRVGVGLQHGLGKTPMGPNVWNKKLKRDLKQLWKGKDSADIIGVVQTPSGGLRFEPMKLKRDPTDAAEQPHWAGLWSEDEYRALGDGVRYHFGDVPIALFYAGIPREATMVEPRAEEALDLGEGKPLYEIVGGPDVEVREEYQLPPQAASAVFDDGSDAVADGGADLRAASELMNQHYQLPEDRARTALEDYLIPLDDGDADGSQVSLDRLRGIQREVLDSEHIAAAEERGRAQERQEDDETSAVLRAMFYAMVIVGLVVAGFIVLSSGGSGIGGVPIF